MARQAHDREDLLRDATALVPRIMLRLPILGTSCNVFAGFRKEDAVSLYFDSDPVYHFNSAKALRRAFLEGQIFKAERGRLFVWEQKRTTMEVAMLSRSLTRDEQTTFGEQLLPRIGQLREAIQNEKFESLGQFPTETDAIGQLRSWLHAFNEFTIASAAGVG